MMREDLLFELRTEGSINAVETIIEIFKDNPETVETKEDIMYILEGLLERLKKILEDKRC